MSEPLTDRDAAPAPDPVPLRANRDWRLLWIGQVLSEVGSQMAVVAYPLLVFYLSDSVLIAGAVGTITSVAAFAVRLPAGALADRHDRRRTMVLIDAVRAVVVAVLVVGVALHLVDWEAVLVVALIDRLGDTLFTPSSTAAIPAIVPDPQLEDAWAAVEARSFTAGIVGLSLGGILFGIGRAIPFLGDAVSYGVSSATSFRLRGDFKPKRYGETGKGLWHEAIDGIRFLWQNPLLKAAVIQAPLINLMFNGVVITVTLGLASHGQRPRAIGIAQAVILVGGLLGAIAAPRLRGRFSLSRLVVALTAGGTLCFLAAAFIMPSPLVAIPIAIPFFLSPITNAALFAAMFRQTPPELQGRVNNALLQVAIGLATLAPLISGLLIEHLGAGWAMASFAIGLGVCTVLALRLKGLRLAEQSMSDAVTADDAAEASG